MSQALIGYTGFVGGNILKKHNFEYLFNHQNISDISKQEYDLVVCAAPGAVKWWANQNPEEDAAMINKLIQSLKKIKTKVYVQISTVDVYKTPRSVNEDSIIETKGLHPYGRNRYELEKFVASYFPNHLIIRLPGLFGQGIKKNFIYDLLNDNALDYTHKDSIFQFYGLSHLWEDIETALANDIIELNVATEPIVARGLAKECFNINFENITNNPPANYNIFSKYSKFWNENGNYLYNKENIIKDINQFIRDYKENN